MNVRAFGRAVDRSRMLAEERHLSALRDAYERLLRRAGRDAAASLRAQAVTAASDWQPPPDGSLFDANAAETDAAARLRAAHRRIVNQVGEEILASVGLAWNIANPLADELLANAAQRTGVVLGEAVQFILRDTIAQAYADGLAVTDAAALIQDKIAAASPWQAEMLARTDLNGLSNGASVAAARLVGVETKTWLTAADERVRPEHQEANGQTVPIDQPFQVCGEELAFPGDPAGSDGCTCNCRCAVVYTEVTAERSRETREAIMAAATTRAPESVAWVSDIAFEGAATDDGRYMLPNAVSWRELPIPLMAMTETGAGGHEGAFLAGKIIEIERDTETDVDGDPLPEGVVAIRARGVFDVGGENGAEVARIVGEQFVRGVSIDPGLVDTVLRDPETGELFEKRDVTPELMEKWMFGDLQAAFREYVIAGATVCPTPAFADAKIVITASGARRYRPSLWAPLVIEDLAALVASASESPVRPPRDWFLTEELPGPTPLTITDDGRVFGHIALFDSCHTGFPGTCVSPTRSPSNYAYFHVGEVETAEGDCLPVGKLMFGSKHAPIHMARQDAARHYDDHGKVAAFLRVRDGEFGIWVAGALRPGLTEAQLLELRANPPSGDWRPVNRRLDLVALLAVPVPGYPIPRAEAGLVASGDEIQVDALIASPGVIEAGPEVMQAMARAGLCEDTDAAIDALAASVA